MAFINKIISFIVLFSGYNNSFAQANEGFVLIPKGQYSVGKKDYLLNPLRKVIVDSFYIAVYETTNKQFDAFVKATSYTTDAEHNHDALVFRPGLPEFKWINDTTAYWRFPNGKNPGALSIK